MDMRIADGASRRIDLLAAAGPSKEEAPRSSSFRSLAPTSESRLDDVGRGPEGSSLHQLELCAAKVLGVEPLHDRGDLHRGEKARFFLVQHLAAHQGTFTGNRAGSSQVEQVEALEPGELVQRLEQPERIEPATDGGGHGEIEIACLDRGSDGAAENSAER